MQFRQKTPYPFSFSNASNLTGKVSVKDSKCTCGNEITE